MPHGSECASGVDVLYHKLRMFPNCHHNLEVTLIKHFEQNCIEVVVYDPFLNKEAERLYVSARKVNYAAEFEFREIQKDFNVDTRKILSSLTCDFILKRINYVPRKANDFVIFLVGDANAERAEVGDSMFPSFQLLEKPEGLAPHKVRRSVRISAISMATNMKLQVNTSTEVFKPAPCNTAVSPRAFKLSPNSAFRETKKHSPESVVEICDKPGTEVPFKRTKISADHCTSLVLPPVQAPRTSVRRRSLEAVRDFTTKVMAPLFSLNSRSADEAQAAPAPAVVSPTSAKSPLGPVSPKRRSALSLLPQSLFRSGGGAKKLPPIKDELGKHHEVEVTVQGSTYIPNPVSVHEQSRQPGAAGQHKGTPPLLQPLSPAEVRQLKLRNRVVAHFAAKDQSSSPCMVR